MALASPMLATAARAKFNELIANGQMSIVNGFEGIMSEYVRRKDFLVDPHSIQFEVNGGINIRPGVNGDRYHLTHLARTQLLGKLGMPSKYADELLAAGQADAPWAPQLLQHNLATLAANNVSSDRLMIRTVDDFAKGVLSDSYRRIDGRPIFETYITSCIQQGLVPYKGHLTDTRYSMTFIMQELYEPITNEVLVFGCTLTTSDYGAGKMKLTFFILRLWCANGAMGMDLFSQIHLGRQLDNTTFSDRTYELDCQTVQSALTDVIGGRKLIEAAESTMQTIREGVDENLDIRPVLANLNRTGKLTKGQVEKATTLYNSAMPVEALPQVGGRWRLSNVLSLMANEEKGDAHLDMQDTAYAVLKA